MMLNQIYSNNKVPNKGDKSNLAVAVHGDDDDDDYYNMDDAGAS